MGDFNYQPPSTGELILGFLDLVGMSHRSRLDPSTNLGFLQRLGGGKVGDEWRSRKVFFLFWGALKKSGVMFFFWGVT